MMNADPRSLLSAIIALFLMASVVWWVIALGLRESFRASRCIATANALLGLGLALHPSLGLLPWLKLPLGDMLAVAAFGLVRLALPLMADRRAPVARTWVIVVLVALGSAATSGDDHLLLYKLILYGGVALLSIIGGLDAYRLLRARQLRPLPAALVTAPMFLLALLLLARPVEALLLPRHTVDLNVDNAFNLGWLWGTLLLNLTLNGTMAFLLVMKLILKIQNLTRHDALTGVLNRRALAEAMALQHARHGRGHPYALVMLDMDRFKQLNDTLGHAAGDAALKALIETLRPCLRNVDRLGRLGGEEFCALLPDTDILGATLVAERMRACLASRDFEWQGTSWPLTASFGVAEAHGRDEAPADVLKRADRAMYRAKNQGRNVVQALEADDDTA